MVVSTEGGEQRKGSTAPSLSGCCGNSCRVPSCKRPTPSTAAGVAATAADTAACAARDGCIGAGDKTADGATVVAVPRGPASIATIATVTNAAGEG